MNGSQLNTISNRLSLRRSKRGHPLKITLFNRGESVNSQNFQVREIGDVHKIINFFLIGVIHKKAGRSN